MGYDGIRLHPVAGKCGVFAETDINGLQKQGVPPDELMASLFEAIVPEPVRADARAHAAPEGAAAGRPEHLHPRHARGWRQHIPQHVGGARDAAARGRRPEGPDHRAPRTRSTSRPSARSSSARTRRTGVGVYRGTEHLAGTSTSAGSRRSRRPACRACGRRPRSWRRSRRATARPRFAEARFAPGQVVEAFIGLDGGSTSHQGRADRRGPQRPRQGVPALARATRSRTRSEIIGDLEQQVATRARRWTCSASARPATPRTS